MAIHGVGGGGVDNLILPENLLEIDSSSDDDASQRLSSQNTRVKAAAAITGLPSPFRLPSVTQAGSPSAEERQEDDVSADMS